MNKIRIENDQVVECKLDDTAEFSINKKSDAYCVKTVKLIVHEDTDLDIEYDIKEDTKLDFFINIKENAHLTLREHCKGKYLKVQYRYYLEKNSQGEIYKTSSLQGTKEYTIVNLNGENSNIKRVIKTISVLEEQYDMMIYHNAKNTNSDMINHGVNIEQGKLTFNVSSFVPENKIGCVVNQNNRIINLNDKECMIKPNMYIDCFDVTANHSAFVGAFKDYELFYLQSRGIPYDETLKLLMKGFLKSYLPIEQQSNFEEIINQYWR